MNKGARRFSYFALAQVGVCIAVGAALWLAYDPWRWGTLKDAVRARFSTARRIQGEELMSWWKKNELQPLLLDARSDAEYQTSHLPGARLAGPKYADLGIEGKFDHPVVVYCAVGFDSAPLAQRLRADGYTRVQYLDGGIFLWANEGRPLESTQGATAVVNPGSSPYGSLLHRRLRQR